MTEVNVFPNTEKLQQIISDLTKAQIHVKYLLANSYLSFIDKSTLGALEKDMLKRIEDLKSLCNQSLTNT